MFAQLAQILGVSESVLHAAIHAAAHDDGRRGDAVTLVWTRTDAEGVAIIYGPVEKVLNAVDAAMEALA